MRHCAATRLHGRGLSSGGRGARAESVMRSGKPLACGDRDSELCRAKVNKQRRRRCGERRTDRRIGEALFAVRFARQFLVVDARRCAILSDMADGMYHAELLRQEQQQRECEMDGSLTDLHWQRAIDLVIW